MTILIDGPLQPYKIETLHAVIAVDANGQEGIVSLSLDGTHPMPLVFSKPGILELLGERIAGLRETAAASGKTIELREYHLKRKEN